jgi:hypothetical protein
MKHRVTLCAIFFILLSEATAIAGPIIKPRKYHGPIPRSSLTLRVGFLGGATNEDMLNFFDTRVPQPARRETESNDFGNSPVIELTYTYKAHPQFAVRGNLYASRLQSDWQGVFVADVPAPDSLIGNWFPPTLNNVTDFEVDLFVFELDALYYFTDASVKEFQPYIGGGFSFGVPYQKLQTTQTIRDPDEDDGNPDYVPIYQSGQLYKQIEKDTWSFEAGVNAILGALYYLNNKWAVSAEGRVQLLQSKFPITVLNENNEPEDVDFDIDYTGFILTAGLSYAF